ncbi:MAG: hypothetical protein WBA74_18810 [Cyclobacteriaceae bacterium]
MRLLLILIALTPLVGCAPEDGRICRDTNCEDYRSQMAAQADFENDPDCHGDLDGDNDGIACEQYFIDNDPEPDHDPDIKPDCPKTSNCGCSKKRKSECASDCCQWIVGKGCKCR